jgi:hypothetical protein
MSVGSTNSTLYVELAAWANGKLMRNVFVPVWPEAPFAAFRAKHNNTDIFQGIAKWPQATRSESCLFDFFINIVCPDLAVAKLDCLQAAKLLQAKVGVEPETIDWRFVGKGFCGIVPQTAFDDATTEKEMPIWLALARKLVIAGVEHLNLAYDPSKLLPAPNSLSSRTGLYAIPLEFAEIRDLSIHDILEMSRSPREGDSMASEVDRPRAGRWLNAAREWLQCQKQAVEDAARQGQK